MTEGIVHLLLSEVSQELIPVESLDASEPPENFHQLCDQPPLRGRQTNSETPVRILRAEAG